MAENATQVAQNGAARPTGVGAQSGATPRAALTPKPADALESSPPMASPTLINQVVHGDCLSVLPALPAASVDFICTDPPFVVGYQSRDGRSIAGDTTTEWIEPAFEQLFRVLKPDGFCVSFYGWGKAECFLAAWRKVGFTPAGHLVWVKPYASNRHRAPRFLRYQHEQAYLLAKGRPDARRYPLPDVLWWEYSGNQRHPTEKAVSVWRPLIAAFSRPGQLVLDPFCGSGSTLAAAAELKRNYLGIEVNQDYWQVAHQWLANHK